MQEHFNDSNEFELPSLADVDSAFLELQTYNKQHTGLGNVMAGLIGSIIREGDIVEQSSTELTQSQTETDEEQRLIDAEGEADIAKDIVALTTQNIFDAAGMRLVDSGKVLLGDVRKGGLKQEPAIKDPVKFRNFLESINTNVEEYRGLSNGLTSVWNQIVRATIEAASSDDDEDNRASVHGAHLIETLLPQYTRLSNECGLDVDIENAFTVVQWSQREEFHDFFKAQKYMGSEGGYAVETWHQDASGEQYVKKWESVFNHYSTVVKKFGEDNDLAVIMRQRMESGLSAGSDFLNNAYVEGNEDQPYVKSLQSGLQLVSLQAAELGLLD